MTTEFFRKYIDIITEADQSAVTQQQLTQLYAQAKPMSFIKQLPVVIVPTTEIPRLFGAPAAEKIAQMAGAVDKTSYDEMYRSRGQVIFGWDDKNQRPDIYIAPPESVTQKYQPFKGALPTDAKARSKIPSLKTLDYLGLDASKVPLYVKVVPTEMISADQVNLGNKVIQTSWGEQTVQPGGFLVREPNGHIYTVAPDSQGLPIGYHKL